MFALIAAAVPRQVSSTPWQRFRLGRTANLRHGQPGASDVAFFSNYGTSSMQSRGLGQRAGCEAQDTVNGWPPFHFSARRRVRAPFGLPLHLHPLVW